MSQLELSLGTVDYDDTGGDGPVVVLLHGLLMDSSLWDEVVAQLRGTHRCVTPTLPLGAHRRPVQPGAELSLPAMARLVVELADRLDLSDVTLVGNDTGGAIAQLVIARGTARVGRVVLVSCEAFDNLPPGLTGRTLALAGRLSPALFGLFMQQLRFTPFRRLPVAFGWLTRRGDAVTAGWSTPLRTQRAIQRDTVRLLRTVMSDTDVLVDAAAALPGFDRPALVVWAAEDRVMPPEHGRRLADLFPQGRLIEITDSYTLVPLDQPAELARAVREFTRAAV